MNKTLIILMAQINPLVGAIESNAETILSIIRMHQHTHDVIVFPELTLTGYPPEDLLFHNSLFERVNQALTTITAATGHCHVVIGHPTHIDGFTYNSASVLFNGECIKLYHKQHLPNYGVFDEQRYFSKGPAVPCILTINDYKLGVCICEDIWQPGPVEQLLHVHADIMLCLNASPFDTEKYILRENLLKTHALRGLNIIYVNQVGGQDELVFDGQSLAINTLGQICARAPAYTTDLSTLTLQGNNITGHITPLNSFEASIYQALVCGLRDYVCKNNFSSVILGLSGGIDSALTLAIAVDALGASNVHAVMLPSRYTASISWQDALAQIALLNVSSSTLSIEPAFNTILTTLAPVFLDKPHDITEENLQARIRGVLLMALSNKTGQMLLSTSNKSETAVGYTTLYGDMNGGFAVLKDVLKTQVYALANFRNSLQCVIPQRVIDRAPSAELAHNQTDQDTLPDYYILDSIITLYMEQHLSATEIAAHGYELSTVLRIIKLVKRNEYKRRQAPAGVKITPCSFGRDWRYPITSSF